MRKNWTILLFVFLFQIVVTFVAVVTVFHFVSIERQETKTKLSAIAGFNPFCEVQISSEIVPSGKAAVIHGRCTQSGYLHIEMESSGKQLTSLNNEVHFTPYLAPLRDTRGQISAIPLPVTANTPTVVRWMLTKSRVPENSEKEENFEVLSGELKETGLLLKKNP